MAGGIVQGQLDPDISLGAGGGLNFSIVGDMDSASLDDIDLGKSSIFGDSGTEGGIVELTEVDPIRGTKSLLYTNNVTAPSSTLDWVRISEVIPEGYKSRIHQVSLEYRSTYTAASAVKLIMKRPGATGETLYEQYLAPFDDANNKSQKISVRIPSFNDGLFEWGIHILAGESLATVTIDDVTITPNLDGIQETVFIEKADSMIRVHTQNGQGSTAIMVRRWLTVLENTGSAITYTDSATDGSSFTIEEDGVYHVSYTDGFSAGNVHFGLSKNSTQLTTTPQGINVDDRLALERTDAANIPGSISWAGILNKGDVIRNHLGVSGNMSPTDRATCTIAKIGSVHAFPAFTDQRVEIPTSEIRMEGSVGKGSGSEANTQKFDTIVRATGDALSLNNSNGSIVTVLKPGMLNISASTGFTAINRTMFITLNAADGVSTPPESEVIKSAGLENTGLNGGLHTTVMVVPGDVIRIWTNATVEPSVRSHLTFVHQEQEVSVAVNNIEPQWGEEDTTIRVANGNGKGSTNTHVITFGSVYENSGSAVTYIPSAVDGDSFLINEDGHYDIQAGLSFGGGGWFRVKKNSINASIVDENVLFAGFTEQSTALHNGGYSGKLAEGDIVRVLTDTPTPIYDASNFNISKKANPSVIGIDGRPVDAYQQEADSMIKLGTANGFGSTGTYIRRWSEVVKSIGSAITYIQDSVDGDHFLINEDGTYDVALTDTTGASATMGISKNSSNMTTSIQNIPSDERLNMCMSAYSAGFNACSAEEFFVKGDKIRAQTSPGGGGSLPTCSFTITKVGSLIRSIPLIDSTVDIPTSEVRIKGANSRGTGAEAYTVKFDNITEITGDAFSVDNSNGTVVTMLKDGKLDITCGLYATAGHAHYITKNAANPASFPNDSEVLAIRTYVGGLSANIFAANTLVKTGDVIRIASSNAPTTQANNTLSLVHQVQEVAVALSNVQPQFEDVDSMIRLNTSNGYGSINNKIRRFSNVASIQGDAATYSDSATEGGSFTIRETGVYGITYTDVFSVAQWMGISLNSTQLTTSIETINVADKLVTTYQTGSSAPLSCTWEGILNEGDIVRGHSGGASLAGNAANCNFTITKKALPSIAEVDVTPFVDFDLQDVEIEEQSCLFRAIAGTGSTDNKIPYYTYHERVEGNGIYSTTNDSTNGLQITILKRAHVTLSANHYDIGTYTGFSVNADGLLSTTVHTIDTDQILGIVNENSPSYPGVTVSQMFEVGDVIRPHLATTGVSHLRARLTISAIAHTIEDRYETVYAVEDHENCFSANIENDGTASITSQNIDFIESVTRTSAGIVDVTFIKGFFTETPAVQVSTTSDDNKWHAAKNITINGCTVTSMRFDGSNFDINFSLIASRQGSDYNDLQRQLVALKEFPKVNSQLTQTIGHKSFGSTLLSTTTELRYNLTNISKIGSELITVEDDAANTRTKFVVNQNNTRVWVSSTLWSTGAQSAGSNIYINGVQATQGSYCAAGAATSISDNYVLNAGDFISLFINGTHRSDTRSHLSIMAQHDELKQIGNLAGGENTFATRIANNGTATITSQGPFDFIASVNRSATGVVDIVFTAGFFSVTPSIALGSAFPYGYGVVTGATSAGCTVTMRHNADLTADYDFNLTATRQDADAKDPQEHIIQLEDFPRVNRTLTQEIGHHAAHTTLLSFGNLDIKVNLSNLTTNGDTLLSYNNDNASTRFVALRDCTVTAHQSGITNAQQYFRVVRNGVNLSNDYGVHQGTTVPFRLSAGEYFEFNTQNSTLQSTSTAPYNIQIIAQAQELERIDNVERAENHFGARIANNGTATITSQGPVDFIQSVTRSALGVVDIVFAPGFFSIAPAIQANYDSTSYNWDTFLNSVTAAGCTVRTTNYASHGDYNFSISATRQGDDAKDLVDVVVALPSPKIAYLKDIKPAGTAGGTSIGGKVWSQRVLNTVEGDSSIVTLSANQFTLQPGTYDIWSTQPLYKTNTATKVRLRNMTDGTTSIPGTNNYCNGGGTVDAAVYFIMGSVTLVAAKTFEIQYALNTADANGLGVSSSAGENEVYTQVRIMKL